MSPRPWSLRFAVTALALAATVTSAVAQARWSPSLYDGESQRAALGCSAAGTDDAWVCLVVRCEDDGTLGLYTELTNLRLDDNFTLVIDGVGYPVNGAPLAPGAPYRDGVEGDIPAILDALKRGNRVVIDRPHYPLTPGMDTIPLAGSSRAIGAVERYCGPPPAPEIVVAQPAPAPESPFVSLGQTEDDLLPTQRKAVEAYLARTVSTPVGTIDGAFDDATRAAIAEYQRGRGLEPTGRLGVADIDSIVMWEPYMNALADAERADPLPIDDPLQPALCDAIRSEVRRVAATTSVTLPAATARIGETVSASWQSPALSKRLPVYLVGVAGGDFRLYGAGFYGLLPGASGPFGLAHGEDRQRIIVPRQVTGAPASGTIDLVPLTLGAQAIDFAVVAASACGEIVEPVASLPLAVLAGAPQVVLASSFQLTAAVDTILSPAGTRAIDIHDGRFTLRSVATGEQLADLAGGTPRFSPTGRFFTAVAGGEIEIYDALDGVRLATVEGYAIAWDRADSFAIVAAGGYGRVFVVAPQHHGRLVAEADVFCRGCNGHDAMGVRIDLDNNAVLFAGIGTSDPAHRAVQLTSDLATNGRLYATPEYLVAAVSGLAPVRLPTAWETSDPLRFSYVLDDTGLETLHAARLEPLLADPGQPPEPPATSGVARSPALSGPAPDATPVSLARLAEFGFALPATAPFAPLTIGPDFSTPAGTRVALPFGTGMEAEIQDMFDCDPVADRAQRNGDGYVFPAHPQFRATGLTVDGRQLGLFGTDCTGGGNSLAAFEYVTWLYDSADPERLIKISELPGVRDIDGGWCPPVTCEFSATLVDGRHLVMWSAHSQAILVFDLDANRLTGAVTGLPRGDLVAGATVLADGRHLVQLNRDGTFYVHRLPAAGEAPIASAMDRVILSGLSVEDELVVWDRLGRFDATYEGAERVRVRTPGSDQLHTYDQFAAALRHPGLAAAVLDGTAPTDAPLVGAPPLIDVAITGEAGAIVATVTPRLGSSLAELRLYEDGILAVAHPVSGSDSPLVLETERRPGTRWVTVVAIGRDGLASAPMTVDLGVAPAPRSLTALAVGFDTFADERIANLTYAASDAGRFAAALSSHAARSGIAADIATIEDTALTADALMAAIDAAVAKSQPGADLHLFLASHGVEARDSEYYLVLPGTRIGDIPATALAWRRIAESLATARGRVFVYIDACQAGATGGFTTNDQAAAALLDAGPALTIFAASKGRELAVEAARFGGGLFTAALIDALAADANANGALEIGEFYRAVKHKTHTESAGLQTPWLVRNNMVGDFTMLELQ